MTLAGGSSATDCGVVPKSAKNIQLLSALSIVEWAGAQRERSDKNKIQRLKLRYLTRQERAGAKAR